MPLYLKFLYALWFAIPAFFFLTALWAKLEQLSRSPRRQNPGDFMRQGFFVLLCVLAAIGIDRYLLTALNDKLPAWLPLPFLQVLLLPLVLLIGARLIGSSKPIKIEKAPRPTDRRRR